MSKAVPGAGVELKAATSAEVHQEWIRWGRFSGAAALIALGAGCAQWAPPPDVPAAQAPAPASTASLPSSWQAFLLPGKRSTRYTLLTQDGREVVHAEADSSASMWRRAMRVESSQLDRVQFSWKVPALMAEADLTQGDTEDAPVRVVLAFEGDADKLSMRNRMMFDLAETLTGERPPYATLMYVWDNRAPVESVITAARSDRIRKVVVESGGRRCRNWLNYQRDVVADYRRAFGEDPGALIGVAVMTDSDNTQSRTEAFYGPIRLLGKSGLALN